MPARAGSSSSALYPSGVADASTAPNPVLRIKVARHSPCSATVHASSSSSSSASSASSSSSALTPPPAGASTCSCSGYRPPSGREVRQRRVKAARDADAEGPEWGWGVCACGHAMDLHGSLGTADDEEKARLARVAVRLDELLEDQGKLLDFSYEDEDITSLRRQIVRLDPEPEPDPAPEPGESTPRRSNGNRKRKSRSPTVSSRLSSPDQPVTAQTSRANSRERGSPGPKRRRLEANGNEDEATANGEGEGHGKMPSVSQKGLPAAGDGAAPKGAEAAAEAETKLPEATADIASVTKGVSIDVAPAGAPDEGGILAGISETPLKRERPAVIEERSGLIEFRVVANDGRPESMIVLTGLKNIFQRQLPKMPREYITRLVLDRNHVSMAIVKRGLQVVGGITYRPFHQRRFAEIVFCAITSTEQVKGYGSHLMNHLKDHVQGTSDITHFLTYADNYAIGYFKKQGFTKEISLDRAVWVGYIKDYEGGTLMMCHMVPRVQYLDVGRLLASQKEAVLAKIRQYSRSHVVHPGLDVFRKSRSSSGASGFVVQPSEVPGLRESGWTPEMDELSRRPKRGPHHSLMRTIIQELSAHQSAWPFAQPVNGDEVVDYYKVIEHPMDLSTMESKLDDNQYRTLDDLLHDANLIFDNCARYNGANSNYTKQANTLSRFLQRELPAWKQAAGIFEH